MLTSITIWGVTFHSYGLIIGIATLVVLKIAEHFFSTTQEKNMLFWQAMTWSLVGAVIGARAWHVMTDWPLYVGQWHQVLTIWQGGLSILGALVGVFVVLGWFSIHNKQNITFWEFSDVVVLGLPFGQAIGRLGNWMNQELYGLPTDLPWKIYIDVNHRVAGYEQYQYFHPLFAYEAVSLLVLGGILLWIHAHTEWRVGTGMLTLVYVASYAWIRFGLEFLRIDKALIPQTIFGVNQLVVLLVAVGVSTYILKKSKTYD